MHRSREEHETAMTSSRLVGMHALELACLPIMNTEKERTAFSSLLKSFYRKTAGPEEHISTRKIEYSKLRRIKACRFFFPVNGLQKPRFIRALKQAGFPEGVSKEDLKNIRLLKDKVDQADDAFRELKPFFDKRNDWWIEESRSMTAPKETLLTLHNLVKGSCVAYAFLSWIVKGSRK